MTTNINPNILKNFIVKTLGADKLTDVQALKYNIDEKKFTEANKDENAYLELDEIMQDTDLYAQFATMYQETKDEKTTETDKEREKEEAVKVQDKGESKA